MVNISQKVVALKRDKFYSITRCARSSGDRALASGARCRRFNSCRARVGRGISYEQGKTANESSSHRQH